jgi:hypothetical protein
VRGAHRKLIRRNPTIELRNCKLLQMEVDAWWPSFQTKNLPQVEEKSEINVEK